MSRKRGNESENELEKLYQRAGFKTERSIDQRWDRTDWFGIIDIMAVHPDTPVQMIQVKTNKGSGVTGVFERADRIFPDEHVDVVFAVRYTQKNEGGERVRESAWRLLRPNAEERYGREVVVDEREMDCGLGDGVVEYLRGMTGVGAEAPTDEQ